MVSKTQKADVEWDRLLAEQANSPEQFATVSPPSYMKAGEVLGPVNEANPAPMRVSDLRFKGYVEVWDTVSGVKSLQPWWLLWQTMKKKRPDGSSVFTRTDPKIPPNYGADLFCYLNVATPEYQRVKQLGFKPYAHFSYDIAHGVTVPRKHRPERAFQIHRCTGKRVAYQAAKLVPVDAHALRVASGLARRRARQKLARAARAPGAAQ